MKNTTTTITNATKNMTHKGHGSEPEEDGRRTRSSRTEPTTADLEEACSRASTTSRSELPRIVDGRVPVVKLSRVSPAGSRVS